MSDLSLGMCDKCPDCHMVPQGWKERAQFGSRELYWIGCRRHGHMGGGATRGAAIMSWNRLVTTVTYNRQQITQLKRMIG